MTGAAGLAGAHQVRSAPSHGVLAVRYAERQAAKSEVYYRFGLYDEPDGPLAMSYYFG